jgi:DNA-directed RNA polymerase subunit K/omega
MDTMDEYTQDVPDAGPEEPEDVGAVASPDVAHIASGQSQPSQKTQILLDQHPEIWPDYDDAVRNKLIIRDSYPPQKDIHHTTYPFLTLYEKTKVLSLRASQLAHGAPAYIDVPEYLTDVYEVAKAELEAKRLPFILKRPLPDGEYEYWRLADLMLL